MIQEKLLKIQQKLKAPKSQRNDFGKYNYRSCEDILEALKPLLAEFKVCLYISDDLVDIGGRNYVKATVTITDIEDGSSISNTAFAREEETKKGMDGSQITGASSSYARKYALNGMFAIDDTKDSDFTNKGDNKPDKPTEKKFATEKQIEMLRKLYDADNLEKVKNYYKVETLADLTMEQASQAIQKKMDKKGE
jgi:hypothetical protein